MSQSGVNPESGKLRETSVAEAVDNSCLKGAAVASIAIAVTGPNKEFNLHRVSSSSSTAPTF